MAEQIWLDYCFNCMAPLDRPDGVCGKCGWDNRDRMNGETRLEQQVLGGQYIIGRALGAGGFGITYMGLDIGLERRVAIKEYFPVNNAYRENDGATVRPKTGCSEDFYHHMESALEEGRTVAKMDHIPHVVQIYTVIKANHTIYIVMEFIDGLSLAALIERKGSLPWDAALDMLLPVMRALEKVHDRGVIHRDIKPNNLMWKRETGEVVLLDFGAARSVSSDGMSVVVTDGYAPVEQYNREGKQDGRVDEYALCATMYHMITGRRPLSVTARVINVAPLEPPSRLGIDMPPAVEAVMMKGLSLRADDRYPTMAALRHAFEAARGDTGGETRWQVESVQRAEAERREEARRQAEAERREEARRQAEAERREEARRQAEAARREEARRQAEAERQAEADRQAEARRQQEAERQAEARRRAEAERREETIAHRDAQRRAEAEAQWEAEKRARAKRQAEAERQAEADRQGKAEMRLAEARTKRNLILSLIAAIAFLAVGIWVLGNANRNNTTYVSTQPLVVHTAKVTNTVSATSTPKPEEKGTVQDINIYGEKTISAGWSHSVGLKSSKTVVAVGNNSSNQCDVSGWSDIIAVSAGSYNTVGLKRNGTVVAVGDNSDGQCDVSGWSDIAEISAGWRHTVGLKGDGTVVAVGWNEYGQCNVDRWSNIVAISAGKMHTIGLKRDGTVVAVGNNEEGQIDVNGWMDIVSVSAGNNFTVGLKRDGTVVATKYKGNYDYGQCDVGNWSDIVAVSAGDNFTVGLKRDGTVVATKYKGERYDGQCDVSDWKDIIAISAGSRHTVGLTLNAKVVTVGWNGYGQRDIDDWSDIILPAFIPTTGGKSIEAVILK